MIKDKYIRGEIPPAKVAYPTLVKIALPSVIEMVLTSLIGSVDTMMVGGLGKWSIAAVGLTGQPRMLILSIFFALNIGLTAVVARRKGEGRQDEAKHTMRNVIVLIIAISAVMTAIALIFSRWFMMLAGAIEGETLDLAETYFRIIIAAAPINALTMSINAAQRGIGNTKITMYVNGISNIVNVIFNYLLIGGNFGFPKMGIAGAAVASVIGMTVGFILCIASIITPDSYLRLSFKDSWKLEKSVLVPVVKVGGNAVLEQIAMRIGFFAFARIVAELGSDAFAAHQIAMQFMNITFTVGDGIGVAGTSLVGQYLGKERPDISMIYGKISQRAALTASALLFGVILICRVPFVSLFAKETEIINLSAQLMIILAIAQPFQTSATVISGCLRGAGDTKFVAFIMMICITFIRPVLSLLTIFVFKWGLMGAWIATLADMSVRLICCYIRFSGFKWASIKL